MTPRLGMTMAARELKKAVRGCDLPFRNAIRVLSRRTFASSVRCQAKGAVPVFSDTSSPELNEIFATFRKKVFLPAYLSKAQRDLIYKDKHKRMIAADPVIASVGGEEFQLEHIDRTRDQPNSKKGLSKILELMQDKNDWDNLPLFLSGLSRAGIKRTNAQHFKIVKRAADAGRLDVILECARRASETGFALNDPSLIAKFVSKIQANAMDSNWDAKETKKALSWVEMISVMLEEEKHGWSGSAAKKGDPRVSHFLIGTLLELSAVRAARHLGGKDEDGKVARFAEILLSIPSDMKPVDKSQDNLADVHEINRWVLSAVPVVHGIMVARTVLDPASDIAQKLKAKESELMKLTTQEREFLLNNTSERSVNATALAMYDKLLG